jgi:hypothetical protein
MNLTRFLLVFLALLLAVPATAQNKTPFQGDWLGWGCVGEGGPVAVSLSINNDLTTFNGLVLNPGTGVERDPMELTAPAHYSQSEISYNAVFENHGSKFTFALYVSSDNRVHGTLRVTGLDHDIPFKFSHGPNSDL